MAVTPQTISVSPTFIHVGPGQLWGDIVDKPADGAVLGVSGKTGAQSHIIYGPVPVTASGTFLGSTIGESTISYRCTFVDIQTETSTARVEKVLNTEESRCTFSIAELTAQNMQLSLPGKINSGPVATYVGKGGTVTDPFNSAWKMHTITVGGIRLVAPQCIAFISPGRYAGVNGPFSYVFCGYNAVSTEGFDAPFSRGRETVWRVSYEMIADTARSVGDQLFQFTVRQTT